MSTELQIATSLRLAQSNLEAYGLLFEHQNRNAAYHAEQAAEHIVYALAFSEQVHIGRGNQHQLDSMVRLLPDDDVFKPDVDRLTWLQAYATAYRYPRTKGGMTREPDGLKLKAAALEITRLVETIADHFGVDLKATGDVPAEHARPPRLDPPKP